MCTGLVCMSTCCVYSEGRGSKEEEGVEGKGFTNIDR